MGGISILEEYQRFDEKISKLLSSTARYSDLVNSDQFSTCLISKEPEEPGSKPFFYSVTKDSSINRGLANWSGREQLEESKSSWYHMYNGLCTQLRSLFGDCYSGYSMFSFRKKLAANIKEYPFATLIFDCPDYIFANPNKPSSYWVETSNSPDVLFPTSFFLSQNQGSSYVQKIIAWGDSASVSADHIDYVLDLEPASSGAADHPQNIVNAKLHSGSVNTDGDTVMFLKALSFMFTNAINAYCESHGGASLEQNASGGMIYTHIDSEEGLTAALISFWVNSSEHPCDISKIRQQHLTILRSWSLPFERHFSAENGFRATQKGQQLIATEFANERSMESLYRIFLEAFEHDPRLRSFRENLCFFDYNISMEDVSVGTIIVPGNETNSTPQEASSSEAPGHFALETEGGASSDSLYFKQLNGEFFKKHCTIGGCSNFLNGLMGTSLEYVKESRGDGSESIRYIYVNFKPNSSAKWEKCTILAARDLDVHVDLQNKKPVFTPKTDDLKTNIDAFTEQVAAHTHDMGCYGCQYYIAVPFMEDARNVAQLFAGFSRLQGSSEDDKLRTIGVFISAVNDITSILRGYIRGAETAKKKERDRLEGAYTKAAIGSIMSRNGSHNIGSHVLSALSHNIGTMPDDRVLYQYLQQRMDYTATVTTDFPNWTAPTRFVGNLMKTFFSQRHLLEHISESEGLAAYHFRGRHVSIEQEAKIKLHLRRFDFAGEQAVSQTIWTEAYQTPRRVPAAEQYSDKDVKSKWIEFTDYPGESIEKFTSLLKDDVTLAIPGGVVGQHAFYTIIENIIRNAAKHDWTHSDHSGNLDIFIDFVDFKKVGKIEFTVWTICEGLGDEGIEQLCNLLDEKLKQKLIDDSGVLRRENWGLAEMKISAGYLQRRSTGQIGGLDQLPKEDYIIRPVAVPNPKNSAKYRLGYRFAIPKSKKILIVVETLPDSARNDELIEEGIYFKTKEEIIETEKNADRNIELAYEYVVLPEYNDSYKKWLLPFRVLVDKKNLQEANAAVASGGRNFEFFGGIDYATLIEAPDAVNIKKAVYAAWLTGVMKKCGIAAPLYLQLQAEGASGGGKALVSDRDLYGVMFRECGHSIMMEATRHQKDKTAQRLTALLALMPMDEKDRMQFPNGNGIDSGDYIRDRLRDFCDRYKRELSLSDAFVQMVRKLYYDATTEVAGEKLSPFEKSFLRNVQLDLLNGSAFTKSRVGDLLRYLAETSPGKLSAALDAFSGGETALFYDSEHDPDDIYGCDEEQLLLQKNIARLFGSTELSEEFSGLIDKLNSAYLASDVFLRKYEENISTLPPFYKEKAAKSASGGDSPFPEIVQPYSDDSKCGGNVIRYVRHDKSGTGLYAEALSGSQSYLNALAQFNWTRLELVERLVENALLRVLIIDERVCNFLKGRTEELDACRKMGIFAVNVDAANRRFNLNDGTGFVTVVKPTKGEEEHTAGFGIEAGKFDILILHQGIIDKWVNAHDSKKVGELLEAFKKVVPYVVVTTGRGRPDNIPEDARVLPFSSIESTLFRKYPEKLVLINTVMNILPAKPKKDGNQQNNQQSGAGS